MRRRVLRQNLGHEIHFISPPSDGLRHQLLRGSRTVQLRRVDVRHPEIEAAPESRDRRDTLGVLDVPGPLTNHATSRWVGPNCRRSMLVPLPLQTPTPFTPTLALLSQICRSANSWQSQMPL